MYAESITLLLLLGRPLGRVVVVTIPKAVHLQRLLVDDGDVHPGGDALAHEAGNGTLREGSALLAREGQLLDSPEVAAGGDHQVFVQVVLVLGEPLQVLFPSGNQLEVGYRHGLPVFHEGVARVVVGGGLHPQDQGAVIPLQHPAEIHLPNPLHFGAVLALSEAQEPALVRVRSLAQPLIGLTLLTGWLVCQA